MWEPRRLTQCYGPPRPVTGIALPYNVNISCENSFFPLNISISNLMQSTDRNAILIDQQRADLFSCGSYNATIFFIWFVRLLALRPLLAY
jgi:hypothetical protein